MRLSESEAANQFQLYQALGQWPQSERAARDESWDCCWLVSAKRVWILDAKLRAAFLAIDLDQPLAKLRRYFQIGVCAFDVSRAL